MLDDVYTDHRVPRTDVAIDVNFKYSCGSWLLATPQGSVVGGEAQNDKQSSRLNKRM